MDTITRLAAAEAIRNLKARYFRLIDTKQWDALEDVFTHDFEVRTPSGALWLRGGPDYARSLRTSLEHAVSCHQGFTGEVEVHDEHSASGIWAMQDVIAWDTAHPREGWKAILGRGHYHETYRVEDGEWRIASLCLTRLRLDIEWPEGKAA